MRLKPLAFASLTACACWLASGCGNHDEIIETATPPSPPPAAGAVEGLGAQPPAASTVQTGPVQVVQVEFSESAPPEKQFTAIVESANAAYFQADGDATVPKDTVEFLNRAIQVYEERMNESDAGDGPTWPVLTDLNQLVRYRILRALPAAPTGKKFVLDPKTKIVSLAKQ